MPIQETEIPKVEYVNFKVYDPVYIALENGYFADHGVDVEIIGDVLGGPTAIQAVSAGSANAGLSSIPALINANVAGLPVQGIVDVQTTFENQPLQRWYVRADSDIQTVADLPGHVYAVNLWRSSFHYTSLMMLQKEGIDPESIEFRLLSFADQIPALLAGEVDVIGLIPPYQGYLAQTVTEQGIEVRELWNDAQLYGSRHVSLIFVNRIWAENNPATAKKFVAGIQDAIAFAEANPDEAAAIVGKYTGIDPVAVGAYHFTAEGEVHVDDVQFWIDWLQANGEIDAEWLDAESVATNRYGTE